MFPKLMVDWKTSDQHEEIRELKANNMALKGSFNDTEKAHDQVTLSLDRCESLLSDVRTKFGNCRTL